MSRKHRKFAATAENWMELDALLSLLRRPLREIWTWRCSQLSISVCKDWSNIWLTYLRLFLHALSISWVLAFAGRFLDFKVTCKSFLHSFTYRLSCGRDLEFLRCGMVKYCMYLGSLMVERIERSRTRLASQDDKKAIQYWCFLQLREWPQLLLSISLSNKSFSHSRSGSIISLN